jgi:DNA-binding XRE family transcriptional regulator
MAAELSRNGLKDLTEEQRAAIERIRARHRTPEYRAEEQRVRELVRRDFPPATPDPELATLLAALKAERERHNVSLTEMHERTGIDRATISKVENGHIPNPTWATLRAYAGALGLRIAANLTPTCTSSNPLAGFPQRVISRRSPSTPTPGMPAFSGSVPLRIWCAAVA